MASRLSVEQAFSGLRAVISEASKAEHDPDMAHRAEAWQTPHDLRDGLGEVGVEVADADWNTKSMSGKRELLQKAAENMY